MTSAPVRFDRINAGLQPLSILSSPWEASQKRNLRDRLVKPVNCETHKPASTDCSGLHFPGSL